MTDPALISVILPTHNRAEVLPRAIQSVVSQTYPHWELIIWDDGSTDDTGGVVPTFSDDRIEYYRGANHGVAFARNRAMEFARGEYIAFLDSDDEWVADKLFSQVAVLRAQAQVDFLFGDFLNRNGDARQNQSMFEKHAPVMNLLKVQQVGEELFVISEGMPQALAVENFIATDSVMIRRSVLEANGGFREELRNSEDLELWWRMSLQAIGFAYLGRVCLIRHKESGTLSSLSSLSCEHHLKALDLCLRETLLTGRADLVRYLDGPYRNTWQHLIRLYAQAGNTQGMKKAFRQSLRYGFRPGSLRYLIMGILKFNHQPGLGWR